MKCFIVLSVLVCLLAVVSAASYASAARGGRRSPARRPAPRVAALSAASEDNEQPTPYQFNYDVDDGESKSSRQEEGDASGAVRGSYSYMGPDGIYRTVTYTADETGFHANIETNEPGVGTTDNPADVVIDARQPPAGAYDSKPARRQKKKKSSRNYY